MKSYSVTEPRLRMETLGKISICELKWIDGARDLTGESRGFIAVILWILRIPWDSPRLPMIARDFRHVEGLGGLKLMK